MIELIHTKDHLVFGCGNPFFGDDGFGPEVVDALATDEGLPESVACLEVGTSIRDFLFDILLAEHKPRQLIVVDAADHDGRKPGEVFEIDVDQIDPKKMSDFSLHQFPTTNMLKELKEGTRIDVRILVAQIENIPDEVQPGISPAVQQAIPEACRRIRRIIEENEVSR